MASAVDSRLAYARLSAVATASRLPTANRGSNNSYTTSWDTTLACRAKPLRNDGTPSAWLASLSSHRAAALNPAGVSITVAMPASWADYNPRPGAPCGAERR